MILRNEKEESNKRIIKEKEKRIKKEKNINWQNIEARGDYETKVLKELRKIKINTIWKEGDNIEERVEKAYRDLVSSFITAHNEVIKERYRENINRNSKNWWTNELTFLKKKVKEARELARVWKDEESRLNVKIRKKEYRKCQRRSVFIFEEKKNKNIEKLFTSTNKEDFWKSIKSYKEGSNLTIKNEDEKKELINELKSLFSINKDLIEEDVEKKK